MSKRIIASITLFAFLGLGVPVVAAPADSGLTKAGIVVEASKGEIVQNGGLFKVAKGGSVTLLLPSGSRIRVGEGSIFKISKDATGTSHLDLVSGKAMASSQVPVKISSGSATVKASKGEFVVEAGPKGAGLRVLSGDAQLALAGAPTQALLLIDSLPQAVSVGSALVFDRLASVQAVGDFEFGGGSKKGAGVRDSDDDDSTGGTGDVSPDTDVRPVRPAPQPVTPPPVPVTPPPAPVVVTPPPVVPVTPPAAAVGGGFPWWVVLIPLVGVPFFFNDDDDDELFVPQGPSPAFP